VTLDVTTLAYLAALYDRAIAETFTLAWRGRTSQLIVRLKEDGDGADNE
jgi:hypothetical protein